MSHRRTNLPTQGKVPLTLLQNIRRKQAAQRKRIRKRQDESAARQSARTAEEQVQHELFGEQADAGELACRSVACQDQSVLSLSSFEADGFVSCTFALLCCGVAASVSLMHYLPLLFAGLVNLTQCAWVMCRPAISKLPLCILLRRLGR